MQKEAPCSCLYLFRVLSLKEKKRGLGHGDTPSLTNAPSSCLHYIYLSESSMAPPESILASDEIILNCVCFKLKMLIIFGKKGKNN